MENLIKTLICLVDSLAVTGYVSMTAMVCLSALVPALKDMAAHGKTRGGKKLPQAPTSAKGSLDFFVHGDFFLVKKKYFGQFYMLGLLVLTVTLRLATTMRTSSTAPPLMVASTALLYLHLVRRLYECMFVHKWKDTSVMHIAGCLVAAVHYVWLPMVFVRLPCEACLREILGDRFVPSVFYSQYKNSSSAGPLWAETAILPPLVWRLAPILLCLWGQYQQHVHHVLLADLRKPEATGTATNSTKDKPATTYSLPTGGWFQHVTCPHYLAEILVYASFAMLLAQEQQVPGVRHFLVLVFVASNLTLSALINFNWYKRNLPADVMKGRKAIFPFVL